MRRKIIGLAALAAFAGSAQAAEPVNLVRQSPGYVYFNRPGADVAQHNADLNSCYWGVRPTKAPQDYAGIGGMAGAWIASSMQAQMRFAAQENCMVVSGWRVVRVPDEEGAALARLPKTELAGVLAPWIGARTPHGYVVRQWRNDGARMTTITTMMPGLSSRTTLSNLSLPKMPEPADDGQKAPKPRPPKMAFFRDAKPEEFASPPQGYAVMVVTLRNSAPREWTRTTLLRLGPDGRDAWTVDGRPDAWFLTLPRTVKGQPDGAAVSRTFAIVAPAGRWALAMLSDVTDTCFGAPFFDVRPGEVVSAGTIDFGLDGIPIDPNPAPAKARLADLPAVAARLRPVAWTNGATFRCGPYPYALEYPDLPYAEGYRRAGVR